MAYRETASVRARKEAARDRILAAALQLVSQKGFSAVSVSDVAELAGVATGSVYRHFASKAELFSHVFRSASQREVDQVAQAVSQPGTAGERLQAALTRFGRRALRGKQLAWALIAEPIDPLVDLDRLEYRRRYAKVFEWVIQEGVQNQEFPPQDARVASAALVGAIAEALVVPLAPHPADHPQDDHQLIQSILKFCIRAITGKEHTS